MGQEHASSIVKPVRVPQNKGFGGSRPIRSSKPGMLNRSSVYRLGGGTKGFASL